jgi:hypothetical protein
MSDIRGEGYGASHNWSHDTTEPFRGDMGSRYFCFDCGACFVHMYNLIPDIFEAMRAEGISETCTPRKPT